MLFRYILRLIEFFPTSCSPHGLVLTSDPTFTKHELLFVLSAYLKYCHTSLSRLRTANNLLPQRPFCTSSWWGGNSQVGECLVGLCHQGGRPLAEESPTALREVERLTRNPEKLANADGRCWKDTVRRKRSFKTHRPPYPTRRGLVTAWQDRKSTRLNSSHQIISY